MPQNFDAYQQWLKIPPQDQPPNHYRLLGIRDFESDAGKIDQAVNHLVARLQSLSNGPHVEQAQQLLNQVAKARICLTDPNRKADYDQRLRAALVSNQKTSSTDSSPAKPRPESFAGNQKKANAMVASPSGGNRLQPKPKTKDGVPGSGVTTESTKPINKPTDSQSSAGAIATPNPLDEAEQAKLKKLVLSGLGLMVVGGLTGFLMVSYLLPKGVSKGSTVAESENQNATVMASGNNQADTRMPTIPDRDDLTQRSSGRQATATSDPSPPQARRTTNVTSNQQSTPQPEVGRSRLDQFASSALAELDQQEQSIRVESERDLPPGVFSPVNASRFADQMGNTIRVEAVAVKVQPSNSGANNYIFFAERSDNALMVFASNKEIDLPAFRQFSGKRIRVSGPVSRLGQELGIKVRNLDQIEEINP